MRKKKLYRVRQRNGQLVEPFFPGTYTLKVRGVFSKGGGHLEDVVFRK
jgi:hypothetical protein